MSTETLIAEPVVKQPAKKRASIKKSVKKSVVKSIEIAKEVSMGRGKGIKTLVHKPSELKVTRGQDPEAFIQRASDGKIMSAIPILKRDKHNPIDLGDGIKIYADNSQIEFSMRPYQEKNEMLTTFKTIFSRNPAYVEPSAAGRAVAVSISKTRSPESKLFKVNLPVPSDTVTAAKFKSETVAPTTGVSTPRLT